MTDRSPEGRHAEKERKARERGWNHEKRKRKQHHIVIDLEADDGTLIGFCCGMCDWSTLCPRERLAGGRVGEQEKRGRGDD